MTQTDRVLKYLETHRGITQAEAFEAFGCLRLSERVRELAEKGYNVEKAWEDGVNRFGEKVRYMRYFIMEVA